MGNIHPGGGPPGTLVLETMPKAAMLRLLAAGGPRDALFAAALSKNMPEFQRKLSMRSSLGKVDSEGFGVLAFCVLARWSEGVRAVLEAGAPVDARSNEGYTPLQLAAYLGDTACAQLLLDAGANVEAATARGHSAVIFAAQQGRSSRGVLQLLLERRASVTPRGHRHRNALEHALLSHGHVDVVKLLLDAGADPSAANAAAHNLTPLHEAAHLLRVDAMRALLAAGANPNVAADHGLTPVMEVMSAEPPRSAAGEASKRLMFRQLRDAGAELNTAVPENGFTLLHFTVAACREEATLNLVLSSPVDPSIGVNLVPSTSRNSMLHICAKRGWRTAVQRLAAAGADLHARNKEGFMPLHLAVMLGRVEAAKALLAAGADPHELAPDVWPNYPSWRVRRGVHTMQAMMAGPLPLGGADELLARVAAAEPQASAVDTACMVAQSIPMVEAFLAAGARPSAAAVEVAERCTPLMRAVVERSSWTPELHARLPPAFRRAAQELVRGIKRSARDETGAPLPPLPPDSLALILTHAAYPVTSWAASHWLARQQTKQPSEVAREGFAAAATEPEGGPAAMAAMQLMPVLEQVLQHLQHEMAAGGGDVQAGMVLLHPMMMMEGGPMLGPHPPGAGGGLAALMGGLLPGGGGADGGGMGGILPGAAFGGGWLAALMGGLLAGGGGWGGGGGLAGLLGGLLPGGGGVGALPVGGAAGNPLFPPGVALAVEQMEQQIAALHQQLDVDGGGEAGGGGDVHLFQFEVQLPLGQWMFNAGGPGGVPPPPPPHPAAVPQPGPPAAPAGDNLPEPISDDDRSSSDEDMAGGAGEVAGGHSEEAEAVPSTSDAGSKRKYNLRSASAASKRAKKSR